jgi:type VI secretion system protein ImpI
MTLRLSLENVDRLPDGGPMRVEVKGRGLDIGRDAHLDWTLPDPSRHVSGKHCEIRFRDGGYWLHDVSRNGTYINGGQFRLDAPRLLQNGDRLSIGPYLVAVEVEGQGGSGAPAFPASPPIAEDVWNSVGEAAAPDDRNAYRRQKKQETPPDFLDFAAPIGAAGFSSAAIADPTDYDAWVTAPRQPMSDQPLPSPLTTPSPRRPATRAAGEDAPPAFRSGPTPMAPIAPSDASDVLSRIAAAAGIPGTVFSRRDGDEVATEIGAALRATASHLAHLLNSRAETKTLMRSSSRTMVRAIDNNPLKFTGTPEEALTIMFGPRTATYMDAITALEQSFSDVESHQLLTFAAMQRALDALFAELAPEKIDSAVAPDRGLGALVVSRKAKLWDIYVERWRAQSKRSDGRLTEGFMALFAEAYDRLINESG